MAPSPSRHDPHLETCKCTDSTCDMGTHAPEQDEICPEPASVLVEYHEDSSPIMMCKDCAEWAEQEQGAVLLPVPQSGGES